MTQLLVTLSRTDSQPGGEIIREIVVEDFVQTSFDMLRVGPEGDFIGHVDSNGVCRLDDEADRPDVWYTDVTVSVAKP